MRTLFAAAALAVAPPAAATAFPGGGSDTPESRATMARGDAEVAAAQAESDHAAAECAYLAALDFFAEYGGSMSPAGAASYQSMLGLAYGCLTTGEGVHDDADDEYQEGWLDYQDALAALRSGEQDIADAYFYPARDSFVAASADYARASNAYRACLDTLNGG